MISLIAIVSGDCVYWRPLDVLLFFLGASVLLAILESSSAFIYTTKHVYQLHVSVVAGIAGFTVM